jgi:hypothetical protein
MYMKLLLLDVRLISHHSVSTQTQVCAYVMQETKIYTVPALTFQFRVQIPISSKAHQEQEPQLFVLGDDRRATNLWDIQWALDLRTQFVPEGWS